MKRAADSLIVFLVIVSALGGAFALGARYGKGQCELARSNATNQGLVKQKVAAQRAVNRATRTGAQQEQQRAALDELFNKLAKEHADAPADPVDSCVLPPDRLRRWTDANAGRTGEGAAASQPDGAAASAAATGLRADAGPGVQPPRDGPGLSPARGPTVQPARLSGDYP